MSSRIDTIAENHQGADCSASHSQLVVMTRELVVNLNEVDGRNVHPTPKKCKILEFVFLRKRAILATRAFMDWLDGHSGKRQPKIIMVFIYRLRRKLAAGAGGDDYIKAVRGRGYAPARPPKWKSRVNRRAGLSIFGCGAETAFACLMVVVFPAVIPRSCVFTAQASPNAPKQRGAPPGSADSPACPFASSSL